MLAGKRKELETVEKDVFGPLKELAAEGPEGQKQVAALCKFGKQHEFHKELINVVPATLRKQPDKRRTFDCVVVEQLEREFAKHAAKVDASMWDGERAVVECASNVELAQAELNNARAERKRNAQAVTASERALAAGRQELVEVRQAIRRIPRDIRCAVLEQLNMSKSSRGNMI